MNRLLLSVVVLSIPVVSAAQPVVNGNTISWPGTDWHQVQSAVNYASLCEGTTDCVVSDGLYIVINHTTGERFNGIQVGDSTAPVVDSVTVENGVISWPDDGWYQVQSADDFMTVCEAGTSCAVPPGRYNVINHTTGQIFNAIEVGTPSDSSSIMVADNVISWSGNDWYQVQNAADYSEVCAGTQRCTVAPGRYIVINHTTGVRDEVEIEDDIEDNESNPGLTPNGRSELGNPPSLVDPFASAIPSPNSRDPFGFDLEIDSEVPIAGGAPTTPKNLRVDLVSNNWAELNWAPSNDDVAVEQYRLYRSDGHIYTIRKDQIGSATEIAKIWSTTSFIDCNFTQFNDAVYFCDEHGPKPGDTFGYQVTAVDGDGQESPLSNVVTVTYHEASNAPVPKANDFYKHPSDTFAQDHDLSETAFFMDKFSLVFEDNFDGPEVDANKWQTSLTWGDTRIVNAEQQYFVNTQTDMMIDYTPFKFADGDLIIEAIKTPSDVVDLLPPVCTEEDVFGTDRCQFLSGALSSHDKFGMTYGYVEGRMKVGGTAGMLSNFTLRHRYTGVKKNFHAPEIDIVEYVGEIRSGDEEAFQKYRFRDVTDGQIRTSPTMSHTNSTGAVYADDYHTYGVLWEPQLIIWYIDGEEVKRLSGVQVGRQQMNIVTTLITGSNSVPSSADDDTIYPLQYKIDYIRAYQRPEYSTNGVYPE